MAMEFMQLEVDKQKKLPIMEITVAVDNSTFMDVSSLYSTTSDVSNLESLDTFWSELNLGRVPSKNLPCLSSQRNKSGVSQKSDITKITGAKHRRNRRFKLKQRFSEVPISQLVELITISCIADDF
jgi:hypothetical protein